MLCKPVVFSEIRAPKQRKKINLCMFSVRCLVWFRVFVKALIGFKALFFFFSSVLMYI